MAKHDSAASCDSPTAWFCELEQAIRAGNSDRELIARRELGRLGVLVTIDARSVLAKPVAAARRERSS
jgi:hypothetical protein